MKQQSPDRIRLKSTADQMKTCAMTLVTALAFAVTEASAGVQVRQIQGSPQPAAFERVDWEVALSQAYTNPFDPEEISVDAAFIAPDGKERWRARWVVQ
jgi:hypothetical protein